MSQSAPNLDEFRAISDPYQFVERNLFLGINSHLPEKELNKLKAFTAIVVYKMYVAGLIVPTVQCPLGKDCKSTRCMFCRHAAASATASASAHAYVAENAVTLQQPMQTTKNAMQLPQPMPPTQNAMWHESPLQVHPILLPPGQQHSMYVPHPIPLNQEVDPSHVKWYEEMERLYLQPPGKPVAQKRIEIINLEEDEYTIQNGKQPTKRDRNEREVGEILANMENMSNIKGTHKYE
jgi:hypothetical protein